MKGRELELRYFRDVDGREADFVVVAAPPLRLLARLIWRSNRAARG